MMAYMSVDERKHRLLVSETSIINRILATTKILAKVVHG